MKKKIWISVVAVPVVAQSKAGRSLRSIENWDRVFESRSRHRYMPAFCVLLSCVGRGPMMGRVGKGPVMVDPPSKDLEENV
jgi:hypothetical protein